MRCEDVPEARRWICMPPRAYIALCEILVETPLLSFQLSFRCFLTQAWFLRNIVREVAVNLATFF
jgi:hypothetical protein